ncbi:MAG: hypothetical protein PHX46_02600 [Bacilli bacterium]|nr:hypothetical protein [Bacilli bacterium]
MYTIKEWQNNYLSGNFNKKNVKVQIEIGWLDWFCNDNKLYNKTEEYSNIVCNLKDNQIFQISETLLCFKEHLSFSGKYHDDIIFINENTKKKCLIISINNSVEKNKYAVYINDNNFMKAVFKTDSNDELIKWINK